MIDELAVHLGLFTFVGNDPENREYIINPNVTEDHVREFAKSLILECSFIVRKQVLDSNDIAFDFPGTTDVEHAIREHYGLK